ncbi:MAG: hypothetical protein KC464_20705 [Myxococcales bacterium]|nr:hypothetical protein [Myxococcales bacterium]
MRGFRKPTLFGQAIALLLVVGMVRPGLGAPGDVTVMPAPMLGADPPKATELHDGDASVATQTGALSYSYPITVPPGRLGNQPQLALSYSSQAPIYGGVAAGWSLSLPEIQRDTSEGILRPLGFTSDSRPYKKFVSTMAGSRPLIAVTEPAESTVYKTFRAQNDTSYTRYEWMQPGQPFLWRAFGSDGTVYTFGDRDLIVGAVDDNRVPLTRTRDVFGNTVEYHYKSEGLDLRVTEIDYNINPNAGLEASAKVSFSWTAAPGCGDLPVGASADQRTGSEQRTGTQRLTQITSTAFAPDGAVDHTRIVTLGYDASTESCSAGFAAYRQLTTIQESAITATSRVDLPAMTFTYGGAARTDWQGSTYGTWYEPSMGDAVTWGRRYQGLAWPTVDAMLVDLDGDGLVDRLRSSNNGTTCTAEWDRNTGQGFAPAGTIVLPSLGFVGTSPTDGCSLNGQRTFITNLPLPGSCGAQNEGTYVAYRWLDMTGDGLADLVTAIHPDPNFYDPTADPVPWGHHLSWSNCQMAAPACVSMAEACVVGASLACDPDDPDSPPCGLDPGQMDDCLKDGQPEACGAIYNRQGCYGLSDLSFGPVDFCDRVNANLSMGCDRPREPQEVCGEYPWFIYPNLGNGQFDLDHPRMELSPVPLESDTGDSSSGAGAFAASNHAIIDLDGDGYLDAVSVGSYLEDQGIAPNEMFWFVWKGDGSGAFHGDLQGRPYVWFVPPGARPSFLQGEADVPNSTTVFERTTMQTGSLVDLNGDGLVDYVWRPMGSSQVQVYWNQGNQFWGSPEILSGGAVGDISRTYVDPDPDGVESGGHFIAASQNISKARLLDYDGDGRVDLLYAGRAGAGAWTSPVVKFNNGDDVAGAFAPSTTALAAIDQRSIAERGADYLWRTPSELVDLDGDGTPEKVTPGAGHLDVVGTPHHGEPPRLLTQVDNGLGLHTEIRYATLADAAVVTADTSVVGVAPDYRKASPHVQWVVSSLTTRDDYDADVQTTTYHYDHPVWSPDDRGKWSFRGFDKVRATNARGAVVEELYDYRTDWSGRLASTLTYPAELNPGSPVHPVTIVDTTWERYTLFGDAIETFHPTVTWSYTCVNGQDAATCRKLPALVKREETVWSVMRNAATTPAMLVATQKIVQDGFEYDQGDRRSQTYYNLVLDASTYRLRPIMTTSYVLDGSSEEIFARTATLWHPDWSAVDEEWTYLSSSAGDIAVKRYEHDWSTGLVTSVTKPVQVASSGPSTHLKYDARKLFVVDTIDEVGNEVLDTYDYGTGALLVRKGPNHCVACSGPTWWETYQTDVDALGRPVASWVTRAPSYGLAKVSEIEYVDTPSAGAAASVTTRKALSYGGSSYVTTRVDLDGHGRPVREVKLGPPAAETLYDYDAAGKLASVTLPDPSQDGATVTYRYTFDSLGRPTGMTRPDGVGASASGITVAYDGDTKTTTELAGAGGGTAATKETVADAFGRLVAVREKLDSGAWATTTYGYDPRDAVSWIEDADGVTTSLEHDWAGRRIRIDRGREWNYAYDKNGNLIVATSPVPTNGYTGRYQTVYTYDAADRLIEKSMPTRDLSDGDRQLFGIGVIHYAYDSAVAGANAVGRLSRVTLPATASGNSVLDIQYAYDLEGNVVEDRRSYDFAGTTGTRRIKTTYAPFGAIAAVDYGDGLYTDAQGTRTLVNYDARGDVASVNAAFGASYQYQPIAGFTRNAAGMVTGRDLPGMGYPFQHASWSYDHLGRIVAQQVTVNGATVASQGLTYWGLDDVKTVTHSGTGLTARTYNYYYDARHQLTGASGAFTGSYAFTPGGRLSHVGIYAAGATGSEVVNRNVDYRYEAADPEMLSALRNANQTDLATFGYDAAGNLTSRTVNGSGTTMLYDSNDRLRRATTSAGREEYFYDADGMRVGIVKRNASLAKTEVRYFQGPLEIWQPTSGGVRRIAHVSIGTPLLRVDSQGVTSITKEVQYHSTLQSLLASVSTTGTITSAFAYGPYGEVMQTAGSQVGTHRHRYNDKYEDELTSLSYYGYRYYDPLTLTWTSADPQYRFVPDAAWDEPRRANLYGFNGGNPIGYVDPDGRGWETVKRLGNVVVGTVEVVAATVAVAASDGAATWPAGVVGADGLDRLAQSTVGDGEVSLHKGIKAIVKACGGGRLSQELASSAVDGAVGGAAAGMMKTSVEALGLVSGVLGEPQAGTIAGGAARAGGNAPSQIASRILNAANHVFGPKSLAKHNLGAVLEHFGGDQVRAFEALEAAAQQLADSGEVAGVFITEVEVAGATVTVRGAVVDGVAKVGTAYIP